MSLFHVHVREHVLLALDCVGLRLVLHVRACFHCRHRPLLPDNHSPSDWAYCT